jgi:hypothetical protein
MSGDFGLDLMRNNQLLYQLSYCGMPQPKICRRLFHSLFMGWGKAETP